MNEKNYEYLRDQLKFTGFGEGHGAELREKMQQQQPTFDIHHRASFGKDDTVAVLQFRRSEQTGMYFFNRYLLAVKPEDPNNITEQTFYINQSNNITLKEAYNLLSGRAVQKELTNKEGQVYRAWLQLDFKETDGQNYKIKQYHQNYGFDLGQALAKHPIKELSVPQDKDRLLESLQRGNRQAVTFLQADGLEARRFVEASPRYKSINVYDGHMQRIRADLKQQEKPAQSLQVEAKKARQQQTASEGESTPAKRRSTRKGKSIGS